MPLHYVDTSALVKRYLPEPGSSWVKALFSSEPATISLVAMVELASALARKTHDGKLTAEQRDKIFQIFLEDTRGCVVLGLSPAIVQEAATMLLRSPVRLRSLDALHLATAKRSFARGRRRGIAIGNFVTADRELVDAASWAGLTAVNPEDHP